MSIYFTFKVCKSQILLEGFMALLYFSAPSPLVNINPVNMWYCVSVDCLFFSWTVADSCILSFPVCVHTVMIVSQVPCLILSDFVS